MDVKESDGGKELPGQVKNDLDWETVKKVIWDNHKLNLSGGEVVYRKGEVVIHDNEIAFQLDFDATVTLSILFDRNGKCLSLSIPDVKSNVQDGAAQGTRSKTMFQEEASHLADMISDINKD